MSSSQCPCLFGLCAVVLSIKVVKIKTDVLVVGAGSAGLSVAVGAVQLGARVVLLEGHKMGGDCLNYGCVPSKALLASAKSAREQITASQFGIPDVVAQVDYAAVQAHVKDVMAQIALVDSQERMERLGIDVIRAYGSFLSRSEVEAGGYVISARRIVIATGSHPIIPDIAGVKSVPYYTNETIFDVSRRPDHLIVIGGGAVGVEMAQAHIRLGSRVTIIEEKTLLARHDQELVSVLVERLRSEGVEIVEGVDVFKVSGSTGAVTVHTRQRGAIAGTHILFAIGRRANTHSLNLQAAAIQANNGSIQVDSHFRTTNKRVYAVGDVNGGPQFTHVAGYQAGCVIRSIVFGFSSRPDMSGIPWVIYTDPELAQVGMTEARARARYGSKLEVLCTEYAYNDRACVERKTAGMIKLIVFRGRPVGVSVVGYQAGEIVNLWSLVLSRKLKLSHVASMVVAYPTISELNKTIAGVYWSRRLFNSNGLKWIVRFIQRWIP